MMALRPWPSALPWLLLQMGALLPLTPCRSFSSPLPGGLLCVALVAGAGLILAGHTDDHLVELTLTAVAAYGSFLLAEHFHLSGVLASLVAGLLTGNLGSLGSFTGKGRE